MEFRGINIYTGKHTLIRTAHGRIQEIHDQEPLPNGVRSLVLSRGFTDIQVNGYRGNDYSNALLGEENILRIIDDLAHTGTLRHLPTLITGSFEQTRDNLVLISSVTRGSPIAKSSIAGIHLEGPYISVKDGARGAHNAKYVRSPDIRELEAWQKSADGMIKLITLAPEAQGAISFIHSAVSMGIAVSLGHTLASQQDIQCAVDAGATLSTHLGNGSPAMLPRLKNPIWPQLANDALYASVIADGFHLPDSMLKVFFRTKGIERVILISDAGPMGGLNAGRYTWGDMPVEVFEDGHLGLADTEYLAGAGHLLNRCVQIFRRASGCTLKQAVTAATQTPLHFLKSDMPASDFREGEPADIICFEETEDSLNILGFANGKNEWQGF